MFAGLVALVAASAFVDGEGHTHYGHWLGEDHLSPVAAARQKSPYDGLHLECPHDHLNAIC